MAISISKATLVSQLDTGLPIPEEDTDINNYSKPSDATPSTETGTSANNSNESANAAGFQGQLYLSKFTVGVGVKISSVGCRVFSNSTSQIRIVVYDSDGAGGDAGTLLFDSGALTLPTTDDYHTFGVNAISVNADVYVGFEVSDSTANLYYATAIRHFVSHTFGDAPDPFGTPTKTSGAQPYTSITTGELGVNTVLDFINSKWKSDAEVNPNIYIDCDGAGNLSLIGLAVYFDSENTETEVLIQTSTDAAAWTTVGTIDSFKTDGYSYIRFQLQVARYIRFYGNSGNSLILAIKEIKYKSDANFPSDHIHNTISTTTANAGLST